MGVLQTHTPTQALAFYTFYPRKLLEQAYLFKSLMMKESFLPDTPRSAIRRTDLHLNARTRLFQRCFHVPRQDPIMPAAIGTAFHHRSAALPGHRALGAEQPAVQGERRARCHAAPYPHLAAGPAPPPAPHGQPGPARGRREAASGRVKSGGGGAGRALRAVGRRGWDQPSAGTAARNPCCAVPCCAAPGEARGGLGLRGRGIAPSPGWDLLVRRGLPGAPQRLCGGEEQGGVLSCPVFFSPSTT